LDPRDGLEDMEKGKFLTLQAALSVYGGTFSEVSKVNDEDSFFFCYIL
jgi:hypothetical protein